MSRWWMRGLEVRGGLRHGMLGNDNDSLFVSLKATRQVSLVETCWEQQRAPAQRKDSKGAQTAVLSRPGSELLQSRPLQKLRAGWYVGLAVHTPSKEYIHLSCPLYAATSFLTTESQILAPKGCCRAVMSHCVKTEVIEFRNPLSSQAAGPIMRQCFSFCQSLKVQNQKTIDFFWFSSLFSPHSFLLLEFQFLVKLILK